MENLGICQGQVDAWIDAIRVRGQFTVFELLVSKIRAIIGAQTITQGCGKIKTVQMSEDGTAYLVTLEEQDMSFMEHDFIRCQEFTGNQRLYHVEIESIVDGVIRIPVSEFESEVNEDGVTFVTNPPIVGDDIVQFGNSSYETQYAGRHSAIYMHADENAQPAIDVLTGIYSKDWSNCLKVRVGGDIPGTNGLKGFYCVNGMLKGVDDDGTILYQFNPDSSGFIAKGNIRWDKEGNGDIFNRAIYWDTDGFHFGSGVKLTWDNLDSEVKKNLKGEPGKDGSSLVYKGEFTSHPSNPQNGWYYRNTSDKKNYVYQDNAWYVMTVDGEDGLDGINGNDGKDGLDIVWKGDLSTAPADPVKNWVYRDTDNGRVYIYNGTAWELMVADGNDGTDGTDGKDGMRVYITYHDSETKPAVPTGNGTTEGWHTNSTASVVWISQKVAESADSGEWGTPIRFRGKDGQDANLLPWIEEWNNNKTEIGGEYMVSPKMFSGTKDSNGKLTGVAMGRDCLTGADGTKRTGIFALVDDEVVFELDPINKVYSYEGTVNIYDEKKRKLIDISTFDNGEDRPKSPIISLRGHNDLYDGYYSENEIRDNSISINNGTSNSFSSAYISGSVIKISSKEEYSDSEGDLNIMVNRGTASFQSSKWKRVDDPFLIQGETYVDENGFLKVKK